MDELVPEVEQRYAGPRAPKTSIKTGSAEQLVQSHRSASLRTVEGRLT